MVSDVAGRTDTELGQKIYKHTGGNPRFVQQVLRRLAEHGWPTSPDLRSLAPPGGLEQMHHGRWQELDRGGQEVLEVLAVMGRPARGALLLEVILEVKGDQDMPVVGLPLERLEHEGWLDRNADGLYLFRRGPVARLALGWVETGRRADLHRAAAAVLDRAGERDPVEWARHAVGAGETDLALEAWDEAARTLGQLGAHRKAIQLCQDSWAVFSALPGI